MRLSERHEGEGREQIYGSYKAWNVSICDVVEGQRRSNAGGLAKISAVMGSPANNLREDKEYASCEK